MLPIIQSNIMDQSIIHHGIMNEYIIHRIDQSINYRPYGRTRCRSPVRNRDRHLTGVKFVLKLFLINQIEPIYVTNTITHVFVHMVFTKNISNC